jgi:hypothetical protein
MRHLLPAAVFAVVLTVFASRDARGQETPLPGSSVPRAGWTVTPALGYSGNWDDNVLGRHGDVPIADYASSLNPRLAVDFNGRRGQLAASYNGSFVLHQNLSSLNSYDQLAGLAARHRITRRLTLVTRNSLSVAPTTALSELISIPFVRTGTRLLDLHGGVEAAFTKRTSAVATYGFQQLALELDPTFGPLLSGGYSHAASVTFRHAANKRAALIGDYDRQHAIVPGGDPITLSDTFDIQSARGGVEFTFSDRMRVFGAVGISQLAISGFRGTAATAAAASSPSIISGAGVPGTGRTRTGLAWRSGLTREFERASVNVNYSRSFTPSYGFGGTMENEEFVTRVHFAVGRRIYSHSSFAWRRNTPLAGDLRLATFWGQGSVGYALAPWIQIEGFYDGRHERFDRLGGRLVRTRVGFQVITAKPVRVR